MELNLIDRRCPVCASSDESNIFAEANVDTNKLDAFAFASRKAPEYMHWRLIECPRCDLLYCSPAPDSLSLNVAYDGAAFDSGQEARYAAKTYGRFLPRIKRNLASLEGALDIGTGDGAFLHELLKAGFQNVQGVEPSLAPIESAAAEIKPLIRHAMFRVEDFDVNSLSLVTCFQTFEHLSDPLAMCRAAYQLLRPGGAVFFVGHNRRSLSARLMGQKSPIFDIEHLQLFSPSSVEYMVRQAGFQNIEVGALINRYPVSYWTKLFPLSQGLKRGLLQLLHDTGLGKMPVPVPAGNLFVIGYKPITASTAPLVDPLKF